MSNYSQNPDQNQSKPNRPDQSKNPQQDPRKSGDKPGAGRGNDEQRRNPAHQRDNVK